MNDEICKLLEYIIDRSRKMDFESLYYGPKFIGNPYFKSDSDLKAFIEFIAGSPFLKENFDRYFNLISFNKAGVHLIKVNSLTKDHFMEFHKFLDILENYILRGKDEEYFGY